MVGPYTNGLKFMSRIACSIKIHRRIGWDLRCSVRGRGIAIHREWVEGKLYPFPHNSPAMCTNWWWLVVVVVLSHKDREHEGEYYSVSSSVLYIYCVFELLGISRGSLALSPTLSISSYISSYRFITGRIYIKCWLCCYWREIVIIRG